jgi:hypothetical protein
VSAKKLKTGDEAYLRDIDKVPGILPASVSFDELATIVES